MINKRDVQSFFDRLAPGWDAELVRNEPVIAAILDNAGVQPGVRVLDVACGTGVLFPDYTARQAGHVTAIDLSPEMAARAAEKAVGTCIEVICGDVETDVQAFYDGDPAAYNYNEIILCYPGLMAITTNRIAHELHLLKVPIIPRMMTEHAHSITGIDIHPGATIGKNFFIDHGTGIVVGETTIIGDNVKVYQGVTIGALSTRGGQSLKGVKRHPTIEDDVIIYAGASILGGDTVIGKGAVIGSNAFITSSVDAGARVSMKQQEHVIVHKK